MRGERGDARTSPLLAGDSTANQSASATDNATVAARKIEEPRT
ncbi:hypothetical protein LA76x_0597 [Lysobacter antibioticus]|uniref:Uncharacterized protein n=1 Tax=Lysobacter antibioticus TaxID=84531 RepID=A0A0S2F5D3_LYSAN|nr:hypothetical protein LA76x_0597 [Lysobacter antibioticus]